jgi:hypothetical protein
MNNIFDALEICLQELENGAELESVLTRYPDLADELRPILKTSIAARNAAVPEPSPETHRRGRARVLQNAAEMREAKAQPTKPRTAPILRRLALSLSFVVLLLFISSNGLLNASASALPGERLYPVKRGWENVRLLFMLDPASRSALETQFYNERFSEVTSLLTRGQVAPVEFAGVYLEVFGHVYVSGIRVIVLDTTILPSDPIKNGAAVLVVGSTTSVGTVEAVSIQLLTNVSTVPTGSPIIVLPTATQRPQPSPTPEATLDNENSNSSPIITPSSNTNSNANSNSNTNTNTNTNTNGNDDNTNDDDDNVNDDNSNDDDDDNDIDDD